MSDGFKILIGYDGSECADAALDDLRRAGLPDNAEAHVLSVAEVWLPPPAPSSDEIVEQARQVKVPSDLKRIYARSSEAAVEALTLAQRAKQRLRTIFPKWAVTAEASCGSPAWELVFNADRWRPDLIVVGAHGRTALGRFVLGSVSQRVLTEAHCSVRVARGRVEAPDTPLRIIVGVDGSPGSTLAVRTIAARSWPRGTEVTVFVVYDPLTPTLVGEGFSPLAQVLEEDKKEEIAWAARIAKASAALLIGTPVKVTHVLRQGDPKHELSRKAEEWGADCIFVGSTGFSNRFERFVLGSVSAAVAARAHCSVEVVRQKGEIHTGRGGMK